MSGSEDQEVPEVSGQIDSDYLATAMARAGLSGASDPVGIDTLLGGRTNATVQRIRTADSSFVLKFVATESWRLTGMGLRRGGEGLLWAQGLLRDLAGTIECPIVDVGYEAAKQRYWVLMRDVGSDIRDRGKFSKGDSARLYEALATLQARHDESTLRTAALPPVSGPTNLFRLAVLHETGKEPQSDAWVRDMLRDFAVPRAFLPIFLEVLGPDLGDAYLSLAADDSWVRMMDDESQTLLHGDLRRANMAVHEVSISLFDWEFCARGPAGCDLQWHNLLHYWGYPPDGVEPGDDCDDLAELYLTRLAEEKSGSVDRKAFERGWKLGWLKVMAQIGYVLADPLYPDGADDDTTARVRNVCRRAVMKAVDMRESLG